VFLRGSTVLPVTDASSVGPLKEGFDLVGRLKYFLRLLRWSLLGTAAGSGGGVSGPTACSTTFREMLGKAISFPGPGNGQFAAGARLISSFDASDRNGFLGLPHFWHEGPHLSRRYSGFGFEGPAATISDAADASCETRSGDGLLWAFGTVRCSILTSGETGKVAFVRFDLKASTISRPWNASRAGLPERRLSWLVACCNGRVSSAGCSLITGNSGGPVASIFPRLDLEDLGNSE
jgi:hypothetical protein